MLPGPDEAKLILPGFALGERDEFRHGLRRDIGAGNEHLRHLDDQRDRLIRSLVVS